MKKYLIIITTLLAFNSFASGTLNFSVKAKDNASTDQSELFHENLRLRPGQTKNIEVSDWTGRANAQTLSYEMSASTIPGNSKEFKATVKASVKDNSGILPTELFTSTQSVDLAKGSIKTIMIESQENGVMLNQSIQLEAK